jgi:hypothetical protein
MSAPAAALHAWQSLGSELPHALSQQTPSAQNELWHSLRTVQGSPFRRASRNM